MDPGFRRDDPQGESRRFLEPLMGLDRRLQRGFMAAIPAVAAKVAAADELGIARASGLRQNF
jgi:hypothetical protein